MSSIIKKNQKWSLKRCLSTSFFIAGSLFAGSALADVSVEWVSPANGSSYPVGTEVVLNGNASATGQAGQGMDLALVLDSSGSMYTSYDENGQYCLSGPSCQRLQYWQQEAAIALVNSLPDGVAVSIVEFDFDANLITGLTELTTDRSSTLSAIASVDASGGTRIGAGIDAALDELTGVNANELSAQQMVVFSDGYSSGNPGQSAADALAAGVEAVHSVALPGADLATMQDIADQGSGTFVDATGDLSGLTALFSGAGGTLVDVDRVEVTLADGSSMEVPTDVLGNFSLSTGIAAGLNTFIATAYGTDGTVASATLQLYGTDANVNPVPVPASLPMFGFVMLVGAMIRRRLKK